MIKTLIIKVESNPINTEQPKKKLILKISPQGKRNLKLRFSNFF